MKRMVVVSEAARSEMPSKLFTANAIYDAIAQLEWQADMITRPPGKSSPERIVVKTVSLADAKANLSQFVDAAQGDVVVITRHGRPAAYIIGCQGMDIDDVYAATDPEFRKLIEERRRGQHVPLETIKRDIERLAAKADTVAGQPTPAKRAKRTP